MLTTFLLAAFAVVFPNQQAEFAFEERTAEVGLRDASLPPNSIESYYTSLTKDPHVLGGSFVDLNGDGYPELILPAQRENLPPENQNEGGFVILANLPGPNFATNPLDRVFDNTPLGEVTGASFDTAFPGSLGHEVQGILAADFNNDGKLDLLLTCGGEYESLGGADIQTDMSIYEGNLPSGSPPVDEPMRNLLFLNLTLTELEAGINFDPGEFSFGLVAHGDTDPTPAAWTDDVAARDGHGIQFSQEPSSVVPYWAETNPFVEHPGSVVRDKTIFPTHSSVAAATDMNRDGKLDLFIGSHHQSITADGGWRPGQMNALYLNVGNVTGNVNKSTIIDGVQFGVTVPVSANVPQFAEVSYDRRDYLDAFPGLAVNLEESTDLIDWDDYLPVFGLQARCNCPDSYMFPCSDPIKRFSATNAAVFTDLNNDNWPDLILTNKGFGASPFKGPLHGDNGPLFTTYPFLDSDMIYINRGVREVSPGVFKWLGFWNRTWDLMENAPEGQFETNAPMGIAVADYDMDGDMDFFINDVSFQGTEIGFRFNGVTTDTHASMGAAFFRNTTQRAESGMEQTDISFEFSGSGVANVNTPNPMDLHGPFIAPMWFGWGATFGDFDMDGDMDLYSGSHPNFTTPIEPGEDDFLLDAIYGAAVDPDLPNTLPPVKIEATWDRIFENTRAQTNLAIFEANQSTQLLDYNPSEDHGTFASFNRAYIQGKVIRRDLTTNVIAGDYDRDGILDLVVLPGGSTGNKNRTLQIFRGLGDTASANARLVLSLDAGGVCANCTKHAIGAKVIVTAKLNGTVLQDQMRELRIGGANGATTHSLPLEFGLGSHPYAVDDISVKVVWPCGQKDIFPLTLTNQLTHQMLTHAAPGPGSALSWDVSDVGVTSPMDLSDGMVPIEIMAQLSAMGNPQNQGIAAAELSLRIDGSSDRYAPIALDHVFSHVPSGGGGGPMGVTPSGYYVFEAIPMRLPVNEDINGFPIPTDYDLRVRSWNRALQSAEGNTASGTFPPMRIEPEFILTDLNEWNAGNSKATSSVNGVKLEPDSVDPGFIDRFFVFPADTNHSQYYVVLDVIPSVPGSVHKFTVTCPDEPGVPPLVTSTFTVAGKVVVMLEGIPPLSRQKTIKLAVYNTGALDFDLKSFERAHGPDLCAN